MNFLLICFVLNTLFFPYLIYFLVTLDLNFEYFKTSEFKTKQIILSIFTGGATLLWVYCVLYFYKFDKFFKGGLSLLLFPGLISPFYFYKVIYKRKKELENK